MSHKPLIFHVPPNNKLHPPPTLDVCLKVPTVVAKFRFNFIPDPQQAFGEDGYLLRTRTLFTTTHDKSCVIRRTIPGPTFVTEQGCPIRFQLINRLPDIDCEENEELDCDPNLNIMKCDAQIITNNILGVSQNVNVFHGKNNINFHTHGLHTNPGNVRTKDDHINIKDNKYNVAMWK